MEFTATERVQRKLIKDGYLYILQKKLANDFTSWECILRRKGHCKARVKLDPNDDFMEQTNQHTHPPNQTNCEVAKVRAGIKRHATEGTAINLPAVENLCRNIRSARQERNLPALPITIAAIPVVPIEFQTTTSGDQFLFFDGGAGAADRMHLLQFKQDSCLFNRKIGAEMVLLTSAQRYFASCTLFTCNAMVEFFLASLLSYPIKPKLLTES